MTNAIERALARYRDALNIEAGVAEGHYLPKGKTEGDVHRDVCEAHEALVTMHVELLAELKNIAQANPATWAPETRGQFREWAQNRARTLVAKIEGVAPQRK